MGRKRVIVITLISTVLLAAFTATAGAQMVCRQQGFRHHRPVVTRKAVRLNLTPEQRAKVRDIMLQAKKDTTAVFTPEQRRQMAQMHQGRRGRMHGRQMPTAEQQEKLQAIRKDIRAQIDAVNNEKLTAKERAEKLQAIYRSAREQMRQVIRSQQARRSNGPAKLQVTDEQRAQLKSIRDKAHEQFRAILTPEQQKQLDQMRERMQQRMEQLRQRQQQKQSAPAAK